MRYLNPIPPVVLAAIIGIPWVAEKRGLLTGMPVVGLFSYRMQVGWMTYMRDPDTYQQSIIMHPDTPAMMIARNLADAYRPEGVM